MLQRVEVYNEEGELLPLTLGELSSGIILKGIDGLDPGKATLVTTDFAQQDGAQFHSARRESRNILIGMSLDSRYGGGSTRQLRQRLYEFFMPKSPVSLNFYLEDNFRAQIQGRVESLQSPMFSENPGAVASIMCFDPDFVDPTIIEGTGEAYSTGLATQEIDYQGSVPTGLELEIYANAGATSNGFIVHHQAPNGNVSTMEFSAQIQGRDRIRINTTPGSKSATLIRNNSESSILYGIDPQSTWIRLYPGLNTLGVTVTSDQIYYEWRYNNRYGGL